MATPANMYAAERCKVPLFKHEDLRWHVDYVENNKWTEKKFQDPVKAHEFYLEIFHKLEKEYNSKNREGKGSR